MIAYFAVERIHDTIITTGMTLDSLIEFAPVVFGLIAGSVVIYFLIKRLSKRSVEKERADSYDTK